VPGRSQGCNVHRCTSRQLEPVPVAKWLVAEVEIVCRVERGTAGNGEQSGTAQVVCVQVRVEQPRDPPAVLLCEPAVDVDVRRRVHSEC
jgi:hypothetical protein